jgi:hypothetical protein
MKNLFGYSRLPAPPTGRACRRFRAAPLFALLLALCFPAAAWAAELRIALIPAPGLLEVPVTGLAIKDCLALLQRGFPGSSVTLNRQQEGAAVLLVLERPAAPGSQGKENKAAPDDSFRWDGSQVGGRLVLRLRSATPEGTAAGLYALLQEKLGYRFVHPRQTIYPAHRGWPLAATLSFSGRPRFASRGFHLHTLHPTELTEQLHDPDRAGAFEDVAQYLDWLARNGQNSFQFFLLRGIDMERWIPHAQRLVQYAHRRGIRCGLEISLAMVQQRAFQAVTLLKPFPGYRRQLDRSLDELFRADWDFMTLESTMGEYLPPLGRLLPGLQRHFEREVASGHGARAFLATHVIREPDGSSRQSPQLDSSGILMHSVMNYSVLEEKAPVYGNRNQRFVLDQARRENGRRETWYWPESSYWVSFDNSVPLTLLTYLDSRYLDLQEMARLGLSGHLTFSSGWEWGYWLTDWSVARWSWEFAADGRPLPGGPLAPLATLLPDPQLADLFAQALELQNRFLKDGELQRYLSALTPFSELPYPLRHAFQPAPEFSYSWLRFGATDRQAAAVVAGPVAGLERYADLMEELCDRIAARLELLSRDRSPALPLLRELGTGLRVGALRARHRALTLRALTAGRHGCGFFLSSGPQTEPLLARAREVRLAARALVRSQEARYRYPFPLLAGRRESRTAYRFGYLYPVTELFFWEREEQQVRQGRFDPFFMRLWEPWRVLGLDSLIGKTRFPASK